MRRSDLISTTRVAEIVGCSSRNVRAWCDSGALPFTPWAKGKHKRVRVSDLIEFLESRRSLLPSGLADLVVEELRPVELELELRKARAEFERLEQEKRRRQRMGLWPSSTTTERA